MRLLFVAICGLLLNMSTLCQTPPRKFQIALVNTEALFDEKFGIRDLVSLVKPLDLEFEGVNGELKSLGKEYVELADRISKISKAVDRTTIEVDLEPEIIKLQKLECTIKSKQEEAHKRYRLRREEVTKNISTKIAGALKQFATEHDYAVVFDGSKVNENAIAETVSDIEVPDVTSAFIKFFNEKYSDSRPK